MNRMDWVISKQMKVIEYLKKKIIKSDEKNKKEIQIKDERIKELEHKFKEQKKEFK